MRATTSSLEAPALILCGRDYSSGPIQIASPPKVLALVAAGRSYRLIGREWG